MTERAGRPYLEIREAWPGAFQRSRRLGEIAAAYRETVPVRVVEPVTSPHAEPRFRILLPRDEEHRVAGDSIAVFRGDELVAERIMPWMQRSLRRLDRWRAHRRLGRAQRRTDSSS